MKLSEAIRSGCVATNPCKEVYFDTGDRCCALGAAMIGIATRSPLTLAHTFPELHGEASLTSPINPKRHKETPYVLEDWIALENDDPPKRLKGDPRLRVAKLLEKVGL